MQLTVKIKKVRSFTNQKVHLIHGKTLIAARENQQCPFRVTLGILIICLTHILPMLHFCTP